MVKVTVQYNKDKHELELDPSDGLEGVQAQLFSLTRVPGERQKLMAKGRLVKDASALAALRDGDRLVLMGTADPPPAEPEKKIVFEEDMSDAQKIGVIKDALSAGLHNMGNTCYLASTLQSLRAVPELRQALVAAAGGAQALTHDPHNAVVRQLGALFSQMSRTSEPVTPMMFTTVFRSTFPQFAETSPQGHWMQQDAEEALIQLFNCMANVLKKSGTGAASSSSSSSSSSSASDLSGNVIDEHFGGQMETRTLLKGGDGSDAKVTQETYRRLRCFIDDKTNFLFQGLRSGLTEEVELRGQIFERHSSLLTLPRNLIVQMMRFGWRKDTKQKTKILRRVEFPLRLDVMEFAHPSLKRQLGAVRNWIKEEQDAKLGLPSVANKKAKTEAGQSASSAAPSSASDAAAMDVDSTASPTPASAASASASASTSSDVVTTRTSGMYELFAVVTHKGRTSDSGHYVSFTKDDAAAAGSGSAAGPSSGSSDSWLKFDDDKVSRVSEDAVKSLAGGGDWDMAYLLFYRLVDDAERFVGRALPELASAALAPTERREKEQKEQREQQEQKEQKEPVAVAASASASAPPTK